MKIRFLFVFIVSLSVLTSCATVKKHIYPLPAPERISERSDFSHTDLILNSFQIKNLDEEDRPGDINYLRNLFLRYIAAGNNFRIVRDVSSGIGIPEDQSFLYLDVVIEPGYSKYTTIILDIPFFYPFPGFWPLSPMWGKASVKVKCTLSDKNNNSITDFDILGTENYLMLFYHWYRTKPIEEALQKAYESAFIKTADMFSKNRDIILKRTDSLKVDVNKRPALVFSGIDSLKKSIAVLNLDAYGISKNDALALTNRLTTELFKSNYFNVVERAKMEEILKEQGFQLSGCTTSECLVEAGKLLNVELMLGGSVSKLDNYYAIELRVIDVETGGILSVASVDIKGDLGTVLTQGLKKAVQKLTGQ